MGEEEANSTLAAAKGAKGRTVEVHLHHCPALQPGAAVGCEEDMFLSSFKWPSVV